MDVDLPIANLAVNGLVIVALGVLTGLLSGIFGVGGGFLTTPLLIFYGVPPTVAAASAASQVTGAKVSGVLADSKRGGVDYQMGAVMVVGGVFGSLIGAGLFNLLTAIGQIDTVINLLYVVLLGAIGSLMGRELIQTMRARKSGATRRAAKRRHHPLVASLPLRWRFYRSGLYISPLAPLLIGMGVGILTMLMGVGGGFILVPAMLYILGMSAGRGGRHQPVQHPVRHHGVDHDARADDPRGRHRSGGHAAARIGDRGANRDTHRAERAAGNTSPHPRCDRLAYCLDHGFPARRAARRGLFGGTVVRRAALALIAFFALTAQRDPILVPEVSQHEIEVRQGFTGTELLLYGAILEPDGRRAGRDYDIVVVLKGPTQPIVLREKQRILGIWVNADSTDFRSAPSYFAVASSRPIDRHRRCPHRGDLRTRARLPAAFALGLDRSRRTAALYRRTGRPAQARGALQRGSGGRLDQRTGALPGAHRASLERDDRAIHRRNLRHQPRPGGRLGDLRCRGQESRLRTRGGRFRPRLGLLLWCHRGRPVGLHGLVRWPSLIVRLSPPHPFGDPILTTAGYARRR